MLAGECVCAGLSVALVYARRYYKLVTEPDLSFELRRITADDWELAKCVRLAALADAPDAFARTLAEELAFPEALWRERAAGNAEGVASVGFFAMRAGVPCGMAVGVRAPLTGPVELNALWVAGNVRRHGVGRALVNAVCAWAYERGAREVALEVTTSSALALALYRELGFVHTGAAANGCGTRRAPALRMSKSLA